MENKFKLPSFLQNKLGLLVYELPAKVFKGEGNKVCKSESVGLPSGVLKSIKYL